MRIREGLLKRLVSTGICGGIVIGSLVGCGSSASAADVIKDGVQSLRDKNAYIQLMVGEEQYIYLLYNKTGEAIAESSGGGVAFYRNDNKLVTLSEDAVTMDYDLNPLSFIDAVVDVCDESDEDDNTIGTETTTNEETGDENKLYTLTVNGKDNIKKVYDTVGNEEYSEASIESLYSGFEDIEETFLTLKVSMGNDGQFGALCSVNFGGTEDDEYTSWTFDGYLETFDWELGSDWYSDDVSDVEAWTELASNKVSEIAAEMSDFMVENDLITDETVTGSVTAEDYSSKTEEEKLDIVEQAIVDLSGYGYSLSCESSDLLKALNDYYNNDEETHVNVFQAVVNLATSNGWLVEEVSEDTGSDVSDGDSSEVSEDAISDEGTSSEVIE